MDKGVARSAVKPGLDIEAAKREALCDMDPVRRTISELRRAARGVEPADLRKVFRGAAHA